jgi:hypothetical protein
VRSDPCSCSITTDYGGGRLQPPRILRPAVKDLGLSSVANGGDNDGSRLDSSLTRWRSAGC